MKNFEIVEQKVTEALKLFKFWYGDKIDENTLCVFFSGTFDINPETSKKALKVAQTCNLLTIEEGEVTIAV